MNCRTSESDQEKLVLLHRPIKNTTDNKVMLTEKKPHTYDDYLSKVPIEMENLFRRASGRLTRQGVWKREKSGSTILDQKIFDENSSRQKNMYC